ncbi:TonB-dependent receptor domain-containing protein [Alloalcanivorax venustensis]|uniref:TonB-dependent receptor domain-containing protein n=1 Tax=Alloalcanivorax venustensis TaxID=172371 RepID=UPI003C36F605
MHTHPLKLALAMACLYGPVTQAAQSDNDETDNLLTPVEVTGSRTASVARELPTGTLILDRDTIEAMPANNLADVLDTLGGVQVRRNFGINGARATIDMQGFGANATSNTLVLLNGRRYSNVDLSGPDIASIPLAAIERIEVLPGAGAALYGNGVVGGAVNIVTRERYRNQAGVEVTGGSFSTTGGGLWATGHHQDEGGADNHTSAAASVQALHSDGYRENNDLQQRNAFADLRTRRDDLTFYLTATGERQNLDLPGGRTVNLATGENLFEDDPDGANTPYDWADQDTITVMPGMNVRIGDHSRLHLDFSGRRKEQSYFFYFPGFSTYGETDVDSYSVNPRFTSQFRAAGLTHNTTVGWDLYDYRLENRSAAGKGDIGDPTSTKDLDQRQTAWYFHDVMTLDRWSFTLGARRLNVDTETETTGFSAGQGEDSQDAEMYEGGVRYHFDGGLDLFAGAQRSVRIVNADEITPDDELLEPQTGEQYTLGASWQKGIQTSTLTAWQGRFDNEIVFNPYAGGFGSNVNLEDRTLRRGVSLNSRWRLDRDLTLVLNGTLQRAEFDEGEWEGNDVPLVSRQLFYAQANWQALSWLELSLAHRYVGKRRFDNDQPNDFQQIDSYRMTDLEATARYQNAYLRIGAYNLEDELAADYGVKATNNLSYNAYPLPERHYRVSLGMEF